jgi:hypothetical protein
MFLYKTLPHMHNWDCFHFIGMNVTEPHYTSCDFWIRHIFIWTECAFLGYGKSTCSPRKYEVHGAPIITVWAEVSSYGLIRSFLLEPTVNSEQYLSMLHNSFMLSPVATAWPINIKWCMQDGTIQHKANITLDFPCDISGPCLIFDQ